MLAQHYYLAIMQKFNPPENFDFSRPSNWPEWKQRFSRYSIATELVKENDDKQINTLIYAMGKAAVFNSFIYEEERDVGKMAKVLHISFPRRI